MAELEDIYEDKKAWIFFEGDEESTSIGVYRRCTECGRYITAGRVLANGLGDLKFKDFKCSKHGEIQPYYDRDC